MRDAYDDSPYFTIGRMRDSLRLLAGCDLELPQNYDEALFLEDLSVAKDIISRLWFVVSYIVGCFEKFHWYSGARLSVKPGGTVLYINVPEATNGRLRKLFESMNANAAHLLGVLNSSFCMVDSHVLDTFRVEALYCNTEGGSGRRKRRGRLGKGRKGGVLC